MIRQRGAVLATTLILTLLVLMLGVAAARASSHAQKSARYERDRQTAFAAAEAALADAERDIAGTNAGSPGRQSMFATAPLGFAARCGQGADDLGLCLAKAAPQAPDWQAVDLANDVTRTVAFGAYTGARMATGAGPLSARPPRYLIELIAPPASGPANGRFYRITAIGFGAREGMHVVLQSCYHRVAGQGSPPGGEVPSGRISWREVPNWRELHRLTE
ncbi:MAG TPA: pilus assembly protein [Allosphingosinicella sp.]